METLESREPQEQPITKPAPAATATRPLAPPAPPAAPAATPASSKESEEPEEGKVANGWKTKKEGFIYVSVKGNATERGLAHGELLANRIIKFI